MKRERGFVERRGKRRSDHDGMDEELREEIRKSNLRHQQIASQRCTCPGCERQVELVYPYACPHSLCLNCTAHRERWCDDRSANGFSTCFVCRAPRMREMIPVSYSAVGEFDRQKVSFPSDLVYYPFGKAHTKRRKIEEAERGKPSASQLQILAEINELQNKLAEQANVKRPPSWLPYYDVE